MLCTRVILTQEELSLPRLIPDPSCEAIRHRQQNFVGESPLRMPRIKEL